MKAEPRGGAEVLFSLRPFQLQYAERLLWNLSFQGIQAFNIGCQSVSE